MPYKKAIDLGVNFFDVAPIYGCGHAEEVLGKAIKRSEEQYIYCNKSRTAMDREFRWIQ